MKKWPFYGLALGVLSSKHCSCQAEANEESSLVGQAHTSSRLNVHIPHSLFKEHGYNHSIALFGTPKYAGSIASNVYYTDKNLCVYDINITYGGYPERPKDKESGHMEPFRPPFILLIDRSDDCHFVQQVRNAQQAGAAGAVIANWEEPMPPVMVDDGSGRDISIPSMLMQNEDADKIKAVVTRNQPVQLRISWGYPYTNPNDVVHYDLWTPPFHPISQTFLRDFRQVVPALGDRIRFTPHMSIADGFRMGCRQEEDGTPRCDHSCTNRGHYCASPPLLYFGTWPVPWFSSVTGAEVVRESLRRLCTWKHYNDQPMVWWDYVYWFMENCESSELFANSDCINYAYQLANVDPAVVESCMMDSNKNATTNTLLDSELQCQDQWAVVRVPTMIVDGEMEEIFDDAAMTVAHVFTTLCDRFSRSAAPAICLKCSHVLDALDCILRSSEDTSPSSSMKFVPPPGNRQGFVLGKVQFTIGAVLVVLALLLECLSQRGGKWQVKNQMNHLIPEVMKEASFHSEN